jgi:predicted PurR-regulated permease PerM
MDEILLGVLFVAVLWCLGGALAGVPATALLAIYLAYELGKKANTPLPRRSQRLM